MTTFFTAAAIAVLGVVALTALLIRVRVMALVFFVALATVFPVVADSSNWYHWFDWVKRYSVAIPICLWAWVLWRPTSERPTGSVYRGVVRLIPFILFLNVAEVALKQYGAGVVFNTVLLVVIALTTPTGWQEDEQRHTGFNDWPWVTAFTLSLTLVYVLDPGFRNITFGAIAVLWLAFAASVIQRSTHTWFTWRAYTLAILVFQDSIFDNLSNSLYPPLLHPESRVRLQDTAFEWALLGATTVFVLLILKDRIPRIVARLSRG